MSKRNGFSGAETVKRHAESGVQDDTHFIRSPLLARKGNEVASEKSERAPVVDDPPGGSSTAEAWSYAANPADPLAAHDDSVLYLPLFNGHSDIEIEAAPSATYRPLPSVWDGDDSELLERMLDFYPRTPPEIILDATINVGRFWRGSERRVIGLDIDPRFKSEVVGDNARMMFRDESIDVVVYDPPHIPNQGRDQQKDFNTRFGLVVKSPRENGYNLTHTYAPFVREAHRVLKPEGILFCKIVDYIHNHRMQWAHLEFICAAKECGFTACDLIVKVRSKPIIDPRWKTAHHARRQHAYWLIFRKSTKCE